MNNNRSWYAGDLNKTKVSLETLLNCFSIKFHKPSTIIINDEDKSEIELEYASGKEMCFVFQNLNDFIYSITILKSEDKEKFLKKLEKTLEQFNTWYFVDDDVDER